MQRKNNLCSYPLKLTELLLLSPDTLRWTTSLSPSQMNRQEMQWISRTHLTLLRQTGSDVSSDQSITRHFSKFHCQSYLLSTKLRKLKSELSGHCTCSSSALPNHVLVFKPVRTWLSQSFPDYAERLLKHLQTSGKCTTLFFTPTSAAVQRCAA